MDEGLKGYIAGIIDGEGSLSITRYREKQSNGNFYFRLMPVICIVSSDFELIEFIHNIVGVSSYYWRRRSRPHRKDCWSLMIRRMDSIERLLLEIKEYLIIKKHHADILLSFIRNRKRLYQLDNKHRGYTQNDFILFNNIRELNAGRGKVRR